MSGGGKPTHHIRAMKRVLVIAAAAVAVIVIAALIVPMWTMTSAV